MIILLIKLLSINRIVSQEEMFHVLIHIKLRIKSEQEQYAQFQLMLHFTRNE